jgi:hypoxanthine phosphoribosyltransferase
MIRLGCPGYLLVLVLEPSRTIDLPNITLEKLRKSMKENLSFLEIARRIKNTQFPEVDLVVGIATGGIVPAGLMAFHLEKPLHYIQINYRDKENNPRYPSPKVISTPDTEMQDQKILLVDDVSVSGKTFEIAKSQFPGNQITTFALKGNADIVLFPEVKNCVNWPWKMD